MKHLIVVVSAVVLLFSCKKDMEYKATNSLQSAPQSFFKTIQNELKDSLSASDYSKVNFTQLFKSKDVQGGSYFVRIGLLNLSFTTDFILLKTDSLGNITGGRLIHVDKEMFDTPKQNKFNGRFTISSLNRKQNNTREVINGKWKVSSSTTAKSQPVPDGNEPAGEQTLPDVVVTSYYIDGGISIDWYWLAGLYSGGGGGSSNNTYTYGAATGGGGNGGTAPNEDSTIDIEFEPTDNFAIDVSKYIKCFSTVSDINATYQVSIYSDIPVDNDPSEMFNWSTGSPGHSFIQLTKSSGGISVQQYFGFYPQVGWKVLGRYPTASKMVDNGGHEFNASLTKTINGTQFQTTIKRMESLEAEDYDIITWNCTDFALSVYNASSIAPLTIPKYKTEGSGELMNTPQGLYNEIKLLQASGITTQGTPSVPQSAGHAGDSHGSCD